MPASGVTSPTTMLKLVDLPAPLGPSRPTTSPGVDVEGDAVHHPAAAVALHQPLGAELARHWPPAAGFAGGRPGRADGGRGGDGFRSRPGPAGRRRGRGRLAAPAVDLAGGDGDLHRLLQQHLVGGQQVGEPLAAGLGLAVAQHRVAGADHRAGVAVVGGPLAGDGARAADQLHVALAGGAGQLAAGVVVADQLAAGERHVVVGQGHEGLAHHRDLARRPAEADDVGVDVGRDRPGWRAPWPGRRAAPGRPAAAARASRSRSGAVMGGRRGR